MTREEIIRVAWQAFSDPSKEDAWRNGFWTVTQEELDDFAALVAAAEREVCAKVCEDHWRNNGNAMECADAIRARGKK